jgi:hypothetical protein
MEMHSRQHHSGGHEAIANLSTMMIASTNHGCSVTSMPYLCVALDLFTSEKLQPIYDKRVLQCHPFIIRITLHIHLLVTGCMPQ